MNAYLVVAAVLTFVVGLVHSVLGEVLIFRRLRAGRIVPIAGATLLREAHVRILWASWHVLTVFGWALALLLLHWSADAEQARDGVHIVVAAMTVSGVLVAVGTRGRHLGWLGLLAVALLAWLGSR